MYVLLIYWMPFFVPQINSSLATISLTQPPPHTRRVTSPVGYSCQTVCSVCAMNININEFECVQFYPPLPAKVGDIKLGPFVRRDFRNV